MGSISWTDPYKRPVVLEVSLPLRASGRYYSLGRMNGQAGGRAEINSIKGSVGKYQIFGLGWEFAWEYLEMQ